VEEDVMTLAMAAMWVLVGLLVGVLAGLVMKAGGYGRRWDVLLALVENGRANRGR
jgi:uncharacterized membrane protein YeaQ/YmgE (transglycosylase-associated protein family)